MNLNLIKKALWNFVVVLFCGVFLVIAFEGIGFREKTVNSQIYSIEIVNLTKLSILNSLINQGVINLSKNGYNVLVHDVYGLIVAGISIVFISALVPFLELLNQNKSGSLENDKKTKNIELITIGRMLSAVGWFLTLVAMVLYF